MLNQVIANAIYNSDAVFARTDRPYVPIVAPANDGPINTPIVITQPKQAYDVFKGGPLAFMAAFCIALKKLPVLAVRAGATASSAFGTVTRTTGHGSSVVTVDNSSATDINATVCVQVTVACTVGTTGGYYRESIDGGLTYGAAQALGTANAITVALGNQNLVLDLGAGTLVQDEVITVPASFVAQGSYGTLNATRYPLGTNTAAPSLDATYYPDDDYEVIVQFVTGGTLGTAGIQYRYSISKGGLTGSPNTSAGDWSQIQNLGTALAIVIPGTGVNGLANSGARIVLGTNAQTIGTGAQLSFRTYAPNFNAGSAVAALNALFKTTNTQPWERVLMGGSIDQGIGDAVEAVFSSNFATTVHGEKSWIGNFRMPQDGESLETYKAACKTFSAAARHWYFGSIAAGDCKVISANTGYLHKRPVALLAALELADVNPDVDVADVNRPSLACILSDSNGNPDCYDASNDNGDLDDYGFITLVTQPEGIYVNNPRMFVPRGTNIPMTYHRDLLNLHTRYFRDYGRKQLSRGLKADLKTGYIDEGAARLLERHADDIEADLLVKPGYLTGQKISVSRTDNLKTENPTLTFTGKLVTKLYPKTIVYTDQIVSSL